MSSLRCTKAIVAVGGFGTRWLPLTKAIEKAMLPVGNRPVIDYIVEDCIKGGITDIYFVVSQDSRQIRQFYGENQILYTHLESRGKSREAQALKDLSAKANFHFIVQDPSLPYGTAVPVMICEQFIEPGEQVVVVMGDQFTHNPDGVSEVGQLLQSVEDSGLSAGMVVAHVPRHEVSKYGIVETVRRDHKQLFKQIVEKPQAEDAPSTLINLSMYVFDAAIMKHMKHIKPTNGEYYLTDALNLYVEEGRELLVVTAHGTYLDAGTVDGWFKTNDYMRRYVSY